MRRTVLTIVTLSFLLQATAQTSDAKMKAYVASLMSKMTLDEKIGQLNLVTPGSGVPTGSVVSRGVEDNIRKGRVGGLFGIFGPDKIRQAQTLAVKESRLHIPLIFGLDVIHGHKTIFPVPLGLSCSWDTTLIERTARIAAIEASADGLCWVYSPMVDIARDPRWGRIAEGSGEDPYLGSKIARAMVKGYQGTDLSKDNTVMACVKHFALYGAAEAGRDYNTTDMSRIRMYNEYLPPYKAAVDAGVGSVMSSFNEIDGIPATGNHWLLTELLRNKWGFKGFVVSDYTSVNEMIAHGMGDLSTVSALALKAGLDMDMVGEGFLTTLQNSLKAGKVTPKEINDACQRVLEAKYKLGLFDDPFRYINESRPDKEILTAQNRQAARETAARSMVLLKNERQTLPLKKSGTIALIGPLADNHAEMLGTWAVSGDKTKSVSIQEGFKNVAGSVQMLFAKGSNITDDTAFAKRISPFGKPTEIDPRTPEVMIQEAVDAAGKADVVVAVVGEAAEMSGESSSRTSLDLPGSQRRLIEALVKTGKPLVVVLMNGRPLTIPWLDEQAPAIVEAWFAGTEAGNAIADVLFGSYNPSGKLTTSFPRNVGQIPIYYNHKNTGRPYEGGNPKFKSDYLDVDNSPLYPFGYGLSYTTFTYDTIQLSQNTIRPGQPITATVLVKNTGNMAGEETVQLYIRDLVGSVTRPVKELKGFQKIKLNAGEMKKVEFTISENDLRFYNSELKYVSEPGEFKLFIGTNSRDVKEAGFRLEK
ncbi:beta-glucosidase [Niastella yeongjuensis]|uniref:Periplasmic beta-glucosidase n=1 Tax=Niastella yeongjuensis TaxID=354355 RepID=A0A1V9ETA1_9BACT|nr:beta-glucosidase BglX [Niastella yeongjuensis]OQP49378.1 beta-glucosidase [Niastella yeongjuensis]SEP43718.1 beta-glucosidase [Niastella yeongjuensis]